MRKELKTLEDLRGVSHIGVEDLDFLKEIVFQKLLKARNDDAYSFIINEALKKNPSALNFVKQFSSRDYAPCMANQENCEYIINIVTDAALASLRNQDRYYGKVTATYSEKIGIEGFRDQLVALGVKDEVIEHKIEKLKGELEKIEGPLFGYIVDFIDPKDRKAS
jgi:hypothetical protein